MTKIITGHYTEDTAYTIENYPYGYKLKTTMKVWIERDLKKGYRVCRRTHIPLEKTKDKNTLYWNNTAKTTFSGQFQIRFLTLDEKGHVKEAILSLRKPEHVDDAIKKYSEYLDKFDLEFLDRARVLLNKNYNTTESVKYSRYLKDDNKSLKETKNMKIRKNLTESVFEVGSVFKKTTDMELIGARGGVSLYLQRYIKSNGLMNLYVTYRNKDNTGNRELFVLGFEAILLLSFPQLPSKKHVFAFFKREKGEHEHYSNLMRELDDRNGPLENFQIEMAIEKQNIYNGLVKIFREDTYTSDDYVSAFDKLKVFKVITGNKGNEKEIIIQYGFTNKTIHELYFLVSEDTANNSYYLRDLRFFMFAIDNLQNLKRKVQIPLDNEDYKSLTLYITQSLFDNFKVSRGRLLDSDQLRQVSRAFAQMIVMVCTKLKKEGKL